MSVSFTLLKVSYFVWVFFFALTLYITCFLAFYRSIVDPQASNQHTRFGCFFSFCSFRFLIFVFLMVFYIMVLCLVTLIRNFHVIFSCLEHSIFIIPFTSTDMGVFGRLAPHASVQSGGNGNKNFQKRNKHTRCFAISVSLGSIRCVSAQENLSRHKESSTLRTVVWSVVYLLFSVRQWCVKSKGKKNCLWEEHLHRATHRERDVLQNSGSLSRIQLLLFFFAINIQRMTNRISYTTYTFSSVLVFMFGNIRWNIFLTADQFNMVSSEFAVAEKIPEIGPYTQKVPIFI